MPSVHAVEDADADHYPAIFKPAVLEYSRHD